MFQSRTLFEFLILYAVLLLAFSPVLYALTLAPADQHVTTIYGYVFTVSKSIYAMLTTETPKVFGSCDAVVNSSFTGENAADEFDSKCEGKWDKLTTILFIAFYLFTSITWYVLCLSFIRIYKIKRLIFN